MLRELRERIEATMMARGPVTLSFLASVAALVLLSAFAYHDLFGGGMILTGDTLHAMRIFEMHQCFDDGQLPCRWVPDLGNGYGFPLFNYYPPLPYYVGDLLHRLGLSYLAAVDALYVIALIGAGLAMFALTRRLWGDLGGLVSAVAYVYAPYLALDVYMRGALAELWALALAPALLWAIHELVTTGRRRFVPIVALFTGLLLLSHSLVALIMAPALALWTAVLLATRGRDLARPALLGALAALWGLGLAAFFTLPALTEGDLVQLDSLTLGPFHYSNHFVSVRDLFLLRSADYSFLLGGREGTPVQIGWPHWALAGFSLPAGVLLFRSGLRRQGTAVLLLAALFAAGVFMTVSASRPIWDAFDSLRFIQFPWRYLGLVSLAAAALAGAWLAVLRDRARWAQLAAAAVLAGLFIGTGQLFFQPLHRCTVDPDRPVACPGSDAEYFAPETFAVHQQGSIRDYLPKAVVRVPERPPERPARVIEGDATVRSVSSGTDWLRLRVEAATAARIEVARFDFSDWRVRIDGEAVPHATTATSGLISFDVPAGDHDVEVQLADTGIRRFANGISLAAWGALVMTVLGMLGIPQFRRFRARGRSES